ncbi:MAG TPA: hypothetical protein VM532_03430 [Burkholderiales bacterium]|jgi:hypothetical protein|nr:hypothetical protein [Burkholderiales bacterium]
MAKGDSVDAIEEVVRAGMYPYWDADLQRATPSAFTAAEVSVSRLAILDFAQIVSIFKSDFNGRVHPDGESMKVRSTGRATVANIIQQAEEPMNDKNKSLPNVVLTVVEDKIENESGATDNPAHALICGWSRENPTQSRKISRGVANRLLDVFRWEPLPD